jgi:hypothetical protein
MIGRDLDFHSAVANAELRKRTSMARGSQVVDLWANLFEASDGKPGWSHFELAARAHEFAQSRLVHSVILVRCQHDNAQRGLVHPEDLDQSSR